MLGEERRIKPDFPDAIRQRVHAATKEDDFALRRPAGKLQQDRRSPVGKCLNQERKIEAELAASEVD
jgi:hypothetical protein